MYCELHAASAFSFLEGASAPEELAAQAAAVGLPAVALADADGVYGAPRFYKAAREAGLRPLVGAELTLAGEGGPPASRLTLLAASRTGYKNLCRILTAGALGKKKGASLVTLDMIGASSEGLICLTGGDEGPLAALLSSDEADPVDASYQLLGRLGLLFPGRLYVELQRHRRRDEEHRNRVLVSLARRLGLPLLAANGARYAKAEDKELLDAMTCIRLKTTLDAAGSRLEANRERNLKSPEEMAALFRDIPEAIGNTAVLAERLEFTLSDLGYRFPEYPLPPNETPMSYLRKIAWEGAALRFLPLTDKARSQIEKELNVIEKLGLAGYFLIVWDIVQFCRREKILVQGRGSAANSAVCYALSITAVDPVKMELLFERFLSEERGEWPDIDLDLPSGEQREKAIQYLYSKYGAHSAAMTANVITYRPKSAIRDLSKAFGYTLEQGDKLSKRLGSLSFEEIRTDPAIVAKEMAEAGLDLDDSRARHLFRAWLKFQNLPRHLGQHSGGMIVARGRLDEIVPLEPSAMPGRVVIQWDKDDCADLGILKIDLLGLGMLAAIEEALPMIAEGEGVKVDLARLPPDDPAVYAMLRRSDTVGVFQLESRAQMASLPRNAPTRFYDIVVQVAIIRPGPIVGGMIRPFFERRQGRAPVRYPHPCLEPILKRTLGVPLFQEQVLRMAMTAAGFTGGEAEELRRAMGFKRSVERMDAIEQRLRAGMRAKGLSSSAQDEIVRMITSFALYGFPESHAASFALIAYASSYLKAHHPAAFYASLLNAWPMGFYHPATLVKDAQRRGIIVLPVDLNESDWKCRWIAKDAFRLGLRFVKGMDEASGKRIEAERRKRPFEDAADASRRCGFEKGELDRLAYAGALGCFGLTRREALWQAGKLALPAGPLLDRLPADDASPLTELSSHGETLADYESLSLTTGPHLMEHYRKRLTAQGISAVDELTRLPDGKRVSLAGSVIVRQRPQTAKGFVFLTLEDETGIAQAVIHPRLFRANRALIVGSPALIVDGVLQNAEGVLSVRAETVRVLEAGEAGGSHDFY